MRLKQDKKTNPFNIIVVDDEQGIIESLEVVLKRNGYNVKGIKDPIEAVEEVKTGNYHLMILDFLMAPVHGDEVVKKIREFNDDLYILLLTGHKDLAPPLETIRKLAIQGYCEKSDKFDQLLLLVESGIKSISMMNTIKKFRDGLNKILESVPKIYQLQPIDKILEEILKELLPLVNSEDGFILIDDTGVYNNSKHGSIFKGLGKYRTNLNDFMEMLDPDLFQEMGEARLKKEVIVKEYGVLLPLVNEYLGTNGIIFIEGNKFEDGLKLLKIFASQAASSISNAFLHSLVNIKNEELNKTYDELKQRYMDTIESLRVVVDMKDEYTRGHSDRVAYFAEKIGRKMNIEKEQLETLKLGGLFHDVGKIGTADDILLKTDLLNSTEYQEIKKHPIKGAQILSAISMFKEVVPIVRSHHERIDGRGYPEGLSKEDISIEARIIAVADAFDAMMSDRLYRSKLSLDDALNQLKLGAGTQFDAKVVSDFVEILKDFDKMQSDIEKTYIDLNS
jgi:putative nucleotidyltransferase with HDIG domain